MYEAELLEMVGEYEDEELGHCEFEFEDWEDDELEFEDLEDYEFEEVYEGEADMFIGSVLRYVPSLIRSTAPRLARYVPTLLRAARLFIRWLSRNPRWRSLIRQMPTILRYSIRILARMRGRITVNVALRVMMRVAVQVGRSRRYVRRPTSYRRRPSQSMYRRPYSVYRRPHYVARYRTRTYPRRYYRTPSRRTVRPRYCVL